MASKTKQLRSALLDWYYDHKRDLPWRRTRDAYAIWVSEIMLQQTRVETVIPYYERFLKSFPSPESLAKASEDRVMSHWSGLGYYRRARLLHQGVKEVVQNYGGVVPQDPKERLSLPGIGRYTAGAIGSIAYDQPEPIVDGNVARVFARIFGVEDPVGSTAANKRFWSLAEKLAHGDDPGSFNQSLMELGATVCTPKSPQCLICPVRSHCVANKQGRVDELPVPKAKKAPQKQKWVALVATSRNGTVVLTKQSGSLFGALWNVPMVEGTGRDAAVQAAQTLRLKADVPDTKSGSVRHVLSHRDLRIEVWSAAVSGFRSRKNVRSVNEKQMTELGIPTLTKKILRAARM